MRPAEGADRQPADERQGQVSGDDAAGRQQRSMVDSVAAVADARPPLHLGSAGFESILSSAGQWRRALCSGTVSDMYLVSRNTAPATQGGSCAALG